MGLFGQRHLIADESLIRMDLEFSSPLPAGESLDDIMTLSEA